MLITDFEKRYTAMVDTIRSVPELQDKLLRDQATSFAAFGIETKEGAKRQIVATSETEIDFFLPPKTLAPPQNVRIVNGRTQDPTLQATENGLKAAALLLSVAMDASTAAKGSSTTTATATETADMQELTQILNMIMEEKNQRRDDVINMSRASAKVRDQMWPSSPVTPNLAPDASTAAKDSSTTTATATETADMQELTLVLNSIMDNKNQSVEGVLPMSKASAQSSPVKPNLAPAVESIILWISELLNP